MQDHPGEWQPPVVAFARVTVDNASDLRFSAQLAELNDTAYKLDRENGTIVLPLESQAGLSVVELTDESTGRASLEVFRHAVRLSRGNDTRTVSSMAPQGRMADLWVNPYGGRIEGLYWAACPRSVTHSGGGPEWTGGIFVGTIELNISQPLTILFQGDAQSACEPGRMTVEAMPPLSLVVSTR